MAEEKTTFFCYFLLVTCDFVTNYMSVLVTPLLDAFHDLFTFAPRL